MRTVSAREANQQFSKILRAAAGGEEVTITQRGVPVAKLVPLAAADSRDSAERERRREEALEFFRKGLPGGIGPETSSTRTSRSGRGSRGSEVHVRQQHPGLCGARHG
jgi:prevent-host-death family protein